MLATDFLLFMQHFVKYVKPSKDRLVLVTLDNHNFHLDIRVLDYCRDNHVILFPFPPHCSHKLQPLELGIFGSFNHSLREEQAQWAEGNPGKKMNIYDLPTFISKALPKALTPANIIAGFEVSGIFPFNSDIFTELDYAPSAVVVTDQSKPNPDCSATSQARDHQFCAYDMPTSTANLPSKITPCGSDIPPNCTFAGLVYDHWSKPTKVIGVNDLIPSQEFTPTTGDAQYTVNLRDLPPNPFIVFDPESMFPNNQC